MHSLMKCSLNNFRNIISEKCENLGQGLIVAEFANIKEYVFPNKKHTFKYQRRQNNDASTHKTIRE